jgi:hypothetical protein
MIGEWVAVRVLAADGNRSVVEGISRELVAGEHVIVTGVDLAFPGVPLLPRGEVQPSAPEGPDAQDDDERAAEGTRELGAAPQH